MEKLKSTNGVVGDLFEILLAQLYLMIQAPPEVVCEHYNRDIIVLLEQACPIEFD